MCILSHPAGNKDPHAVVSRVGGLIRYLLSQNPKAEARVVAELGAAGLLVTKERPKPRALEYADLSKLPYLSAVIKVLYCLFAGEQWLNIHCLTGVTLPG